ncbi:MAG: methyltransferase domain-containing protein [Pseudomonadota bacterium]
MMGDQIDTTEALEAWYARDGGKHLFASTQTAVNNVLDTAFGYHLLQTGCSRGHALYHSSPINHRVYAAEKPGEQINLVAGANELPLDSDCVDTVVAHHTLDFADNPHQVLREIQRVLTPQGQLIVIGFNPHSLRGIGSRIKGLKRASLWHHHAPVSESRLTDWLHLLGCEVESRTRLGAVPIVGGGALRRWLTRLDTWSNKHNLPGGSIYMLRAIKQVSAVHRPKRAWQLSRRPLIGLVPKPSPAPSPTPYKPTRGQVVGQQKSRDRYH